MTPALGITDPVSFATHLIGGVVCLVCAFRLVHAGVRAEGKRRAAPLIIFAAASALTMLASALFHAMPLDTGARNVTQRIDHAMIFVLIAATFTPASARRRAISPQIAPDAPVIQAIFQG